MYPLSPRVSLVLCRLFGRSSVPWVTLYLVPLVTSLPWVTLCPAFLSLGPFLSLPLVFFSCRVLPFALRMGYLALSGLSCANMRRVGYLVVSVACCSSTWRS